MRWKDAQYFAAIEGLNPGPLSQLAFTLELNAGHCETAFRQALQSALQSETDSAVSLWKIDCHDRIYCSMSPSQ